MPPQIRIDAPTSTIVPGPGTTPTDVQAEQASAGAQVQGEKATQESWAGVQQIATTVMREETLKLAQEDAAQVLTPGDLEGKRGWGGLVYNQAYKQAAIEQYRGIALNEAQAKGQELAIQYPTNPGKVAELLGAYLEDKKKAMPDYMASVMTPHFDGVYRGAIASSTAGKVREDMAVLDKNSKQALEGYVLTYSSAMNDPAYKNGTAEDRQRTDALYADKWKMVEGMMAGAGHAPAYIADVKAHAGMLAEANVKGADLKVRAATMATNPVGIAKLAEEADAWARDPKRASYYGQSLTILNQYIARGQQMASATREQIQIDQQMLTGDIADQVARLNAGQKGPNPALTAMEYTEAMNALTQKALRVGAGRLPGQQAQLLAAAGDYGPVVQQMYGSAMIQAQGRMQFGATQEIRDQGRAEVAAIVGDPHVKAMAPNSLQMAALYQNGQKLLAMSAVEATIPDQAQMRVGFQSKEMTPANAASAFMYGVRNGLIGNIPGQTTPEQARADLAIGLAKNKEFKDKEKAAQIAHERANPPAGSSSWPEPPTDKQIADKRELYPDIFTKPKADGKREQVPFDPNYAPHFDTAISTVVKSLYLPDEVKNWAANLSSTSSPGDQVKAVALHDRVYAAVAEKYKDLPEEVRFAKISAVTATVLGDKALKNVETFRPNPGDTAKVEAQARADSSNADRSATKGERSSFAQSLTGNFLMGIAADYKGGNAPPAIAAARGVMSFIGGMFPTAQRGVEFLNSMTMFENHALYAAVGGLQQFGKPGGVGVPPEGNLRIDPNAEAYLDKLVTGPSGYMTEHGAMWDRQHVDKNKQGLVMALTKNPDNRLSIVWHKDREGNDHAVVTLDALESKFNEIHRQPGAPAWTSDEIKGGMFSAYSAHMPYIMNQANPDSVQFTTEYSGGRPVYFMEMANKDLSKPPFRVQVTPDHANIQAWRTDIAKNLAERFEMPSFYNFIRGVPGVSLADSFVAQGRQAAMIDAASGRNGPGENWTALIDNVRAGVEVFRDEQVRMGNTNIMVPTPADWDRIRRPEMQATINEMGSLYALIFGSQKQLPVLGRTPSTEAEGRPPEPSVPPVTGTSPMETSLELQRRAEQARSTADPLTKKLIESLPRPQRPVSPGAKKPVPGEPNAGGGG